MGGAISLVIFAGSELFTGNTMVMTFGRLQRKVKIWQLLLIWIFSWIGNLVGSLLISYIFYISNLATVINDLLNNLVNLKISLSIPSLILRGFLCNLLVCLAIWTSSRLKEDLAKIIIIFWCLFVFIASGFEHSIANMSLIGIGVFQKLTNWGSYFYNLLWVTLGNTLSGVLLAFSYHKISR